MSDIDTEAFAKCATGNKRKELAERFTQYLKSRDTKDNAYVVNLNGVWGTGKTFFVTEWKKLVEDKGHIAIKIDAWESDYLNDPIAIIIAELLEQIKENENISDEDKKFNVIQEQVSSTVIKCSKNILPILGNMFGKHLLGEEATTLVKSIVSSVVNQETVKNDLTMGKLGLDVVEQHQRHKAFKTDFIAQVKELIKFVNEGNKKEQKVFVFIDELDRCRPTYAIEMLETVKHLFDIPNFIFVLSTDTSQLQHSIKAVYGHDFDSHEYLSRFFEQRFTLPELDYFEFLTAEEIFETEDFKPLPTLPAINTAEELRAAVALICEQNKYHLSLRRVKQICVQLEIVLDSKELRENAYPILTLIGLVFGNALYGGWPEPKLPLDKARLALTKANVSNEIPIYLNNLEVHGVGSDIRTSTNIMKSQVLIQQCLKALNEIVNDNSPTQVFGNTRQNVIFANQCFTLVPIKPSELSDRRNQLLQSFTREKFLTNEQELLQIIENLNIQIDIVEE